jgi:hypothetical protein
MARPSPLALQGWDGINECECLLRVVTIGPSELNRQRNSPSVANQMTIAAQLRSVGRIRACLGPPKTARTEQLSKEVDQLKMPASCQSRNRRQQLIPEPQFTSCGSIRQGIPLRRTNKTPWRQARSDRRGLPPWGLGFGVGRSGSIRFHRASGRRGVAMKTPFE